MELQMGGIEFENEESKIYNIIDELKLDIIAFKKNLFNILVSNDNQYKASSMGAMVGFHALFLQTIGYWISLLNNNKHSKPIFKDSNINNEFDKLTKNILVIKSYSPNAGTLLYTMLFNLSIQHPYDLGQSKNADLE